MGQGKRLMEQQEALHGMAMDVLLRVGALEECEFHSGTCFCGNEGIESAYKIANSEITRGEIELPPKMSRRDFTDLIKEVYDDNSFAEICPICERMLAED